MFAVALAGCFGFIAVCWWLYCCGHLDEIDDERRDRILAAAADVRGRSYTPRASRPPRGRRGDGPSATQSPRQLLCLEMSCRRLKGHDGPHVGNYTLDDGDAQ